MIIEELNNNKNDAISFKKSLGTVITKGAEFASIVSTAVTLLSLWRNMKEKSGQKKAKIKK